ncbi:MAG TPA: carbohydrate binding family 9 domain-containing protein, partial [Flavobacterium sp.]|nr:carbohydrate binding family 9 domain-containing protein [Flavobacterium sp.]
MCPTYKQVIPYLLLTFLLTTGVFGQPQLPPKKILFAERIGEPIAIDGELIEDVWQTAEAGTDFVMYAPDNGRPISPTKKTIVKVLYDDEALYVAAMMYDDEPHLMLHEVTQRDNFGSAENFGVFLNGFNDGQQDFRFFVSSAGVQMDCLMTEATGEDFTWDAIWDSSVRIT